MENKIAGRLVLGVLFCVVVAPILAIAVAGVVFRDRGGVVMRSTFGHVSDVVGVRPLGADRTGGIESSDIRFGGMDCDCSNRAGTVSSMSLRVGPGRAITFIKPSNNNGAALTGLVAEFFSTRDNRILINKIGIGGVRGRRLGGAISCIFRGDGLVGTDVHSGILLKGPGTDVRRIVSTLRGTRYLSVVSGFSGNVRAIVKDGNMCLSNNRAREVTVTETVLGGSPVIVLSRTATFTSPSGRIGVRGTLSRLSGSGAIVVVTRELSAIGGTSYVFMLRGNGLIRRKDTGRLGSGGNLFTSVFGGCLASMG